ncbi:hypothetical protein LC55x_0643 [Lysobacter capsici]|nr:hypothetical protein LC55x_0643 [Lysobacter capsici]
MRRGPVAACASQQNGHGHVDAVTVFHSRYFSWKSVDAVTFN